MHHGLCRPWRVSIHAPAWGATRLLTPALWGMAFQSTHPRGVRLRNYYDHIRSMQVSIHAPAWGATSYPGVRRLTPLVSIHAPAWGATRASALPAWRSSVSIHAPAWGATRRRACSTTWTFIRFQSTHPRGVRPQGRLQPCQHQGFNPRTRVGCDVPVAGHCRCVAGSFNPRTRVGCDETVLYVAADGTLFQSTHPRGVRPQMVATMPRPKPFQSTHPRGVRQAGPFVSCGEEGFQSTHPRGVRPMPPSSHTGTLWSFNPRTRVGCDRCR